MTVAEALAWGRNALRARGFEADAARILASGLGQDAAWIVAHGDEPLGERAHLRFVSAIERRASGVPLPYITGTAGFFGRDFVVTPDVLVPRPESEHLIDDVLATFNGARDLRVLDVGTGSGALAVTLACEGASVVATDVSAAALEVARRNAARLGVAGRVEFLETNLVDGLAERTDAFDAIVANLPYVPTPDIAPAPDPVSFEPRIALDGGTDGLELYRSLLAALPRRRLRRHGLVLLEAAPPTMPGLRSLAQRAFPGAAIAVGKDYAGLERYVRIELDGVRVMEPG